MAKDEYLVCWFDYAKGAPCFIFYDTLYEAKARVLSLADTADADIYRQYIEEVDVNGLH